MQVIYHTAITLLSHFTEKRLNRSREEPHSEPRRASSRLQKSLFPTPNMALTDSKYVTYQLQIRHIRGINDVLNSQKHGIRLYISLIYKGAMLGGQVCYLPNYQECKLQQKAYLPN